MQRFDLEYWRKVDAERAFPTEFFETMAHTGYFGTFIPEAYGGVDAGPRVASVLAWLAASMITFRLVYDPVSYAQAGWLLGAALVQLGVHALWVMPRSVAASPAAPGSLA